MNRKLVFLIAILLSISGILRAQTTLKIGHVNIPELVQNHPSADSLKLLLEKETKEMEDMYAEMIKEHEKKLKEFEAGKAGFSDFVRTSKEQDLIEMAQKIQTYNQTAQQQLQRRNIELLEPVSKEINEVLQVYALKNGFTYILDIGNGSVAYFSPDSENVTQAVLEEIKKKYTSTQ